MTEPLARAARAIGDTPHEGTTQETLEMAARAALAETREPTDAMITAGQKIMGPRYWTLLEALWRTMHDAMMNE